MLGFAVLAFAVLAFAVFVFAVLAFAVLAFAVLAFAPPIVLRMCWEGGWECDPIDGIPRSGA